MTTGMVLDLLLAVLLAATIGYAMLLKNRLDILRKSKEEMGGLIKDFMSATEQARLGMEELRKASDGSGRVLREMVDEAQALREDLGFLIERGGTLADRLQQNTRGARSTPIGAGRDTKISPQQNADDPALNLRKILEATR